MSQINYVSPCVIIILQRAPALELLHSLLLLESWLYFGESYSTDPAYPYKGPEDHMTFRVTHRQETDLSLVNITAL